MASSVPAVSRMSHYLKLASIAVLALGCALETGLAEPGEPRELPGGKADGVGIEEFFGPGSFYYFRVDGWPADRRAPADLDEALAFPGSELRIYRARPAAPQHCPDSEVSADDLVFSTRHFSMRTSGNLTNGTPKSSYKLRSLRYLCDDDGNEDPNGTRRCRDTVADMDTFNLKSMWNDVSQMREAIAWGAFAEAGVHAPRHTYARFCVGDRYFGLYSVIEQVDDRFLERHFDGNEDGNLYKAYWADIGPADLTLRGETGSEYFTAPVIATGLPLNLADGRTGASRRRCDPNDANAGRTRVSVDVRGFGSLSEVEVSLAVRHEDLDDLRIVVEQDGVERAVLWSCEGGAGEPRNARLEQGGLLRLTEDVTTRARSSGGHAGDGRWTLRVEDYREFRTGAIVDFRVQRPRSYRLQTNDDLDDATSAPLRTYDDLARFISVIHSADPQSDDYRARVEDVFDVYTFLRWASVNVLLGAWDNYWATPANYYLYNSGRRGRDGDLEGESAFMEHPYFHFIPWDYDNSVGIDYFDVEWHRADILDIEAATAGYYDNGDRSELPLLTEILQNPTFRAYYLDHLEYVLDAVLNERVIRERIGGENPNRDGGLWDLVRDSAFLESDTPAGAAHTGRQFTNDQVFWNGFRGYSLRLGGQHILGILRDPDGRGGYMHLREESAREDLGNLRRSIPRGSSGATFPASPGRLPHIRDRLR